MISDFTNSNNYKVIVLPTGQGVILLYFNLISSENCLYLSKIPKLPNSYLYRVERKSLFQ